MKRECPDMCEGWKYWHNNYGELSVGFLSTIPGCPWCHKLWEEEVKMERVEIVRKLYIFPDGSELIPENNGEKERAMKYHDAHAITLIGYDLRPAPRRVKHREEIGMPTDRNTVYIPDRICDKRPRIYAEWESPAEYRGGRE